MVDSDRSLMFSKYQDNWWRSYLTPIPIRYHHYIETLPPKNVVTYWSFELDSILITVLSSAALSIYQVPDFHTIDT